MSVMVEGVTIGAFDGAPLLEDATLNFGAGRRCTPLPYSCV
jgi:hypothetical protein